jgi:type III pantothenate kinase|tara:strand:- start:1905 stop:2678 length:774 start_codon:yes stop_codon:yes gene_type:complete
MILCLDIGNSNIHGGVFDQDNLILQFRKTSQGTKTTSDEFGLFLTSVLRENGVDPGTIDHIALCSVVPDADYSIRNGCIKYFNLTPFQLQPGAKTGLDIKYRNPLEVGSDRIANAIAATHAFPDKNIIIVDFGTATTFDILSSDREYLGGVILPGIRISMEALESRTARLPSVEIVRKNEIVGRSTIQSIQSGLYFGQMNSVKGIIGQITSESYNGSPPLVIGTGGFANLFEEEKLFDEIIKDLVLQGLYLALKMNL